MKVNKSVKTVCAIYVFVVLIMLLCNILTQKYVDDYGYCFSFVDGKRITNFFDVFPSIAAHAQSMNGRLVAHFFVQTFLLLPDLIFDIVNSLMFLAQLVLIYIIAKRPKEHNALLLLSVFAMLWIFEPAFGQVNLWLDGSCNYLWSVVFGLLFMLPYINSFLCDKKISKVHVKILFVVFGFAVGGYLENVSAAIIFMVAILLLLTAFHKRHKVGIYEILGLISSIAGYVFMMSAPGEVKNKVTEHSFEILVSNFMNALEMLTKFVPVIFGFVILFVMAWFMKADKDKITLSLIFAAGAMCANFVFAVASYYPERCAFCTVILFTVANTVLMGELFATKLQSIITALAAVLVTAFLYYGCVGINDIQLTYTANKANIEHIALCKAYGIQDVHLTVISAKTKYSAVRGLKYLDTEETEMWPNNSIAKYYGVNSVMGMK